DRADEAQRRWALQISCISSAATFQMPQGVRPDGRVEEFVTSVEAQASPATAGEPSPEARAAWVGTGRDSGGVLEGCGTWSAPADEVLHAERSPPASKPRWIQSARFSGEMVLGGSPASQVSGAVRM